MASANLYERLILQPPPGTHRPPRPPRSSAAVVPWRRRGGTLEVFWVRRSPQLRFMGGWHAFPGGGLNRTDPDEEKAISFEGSPQGAEIAPTTGMTAALLDDLPPLAPNLAPGIAACALRELFEETGILPLEPGGASVREHRQALEDERRVLLADERPFPEILQRFGLTPNLSRLVYAGRWITPPLAPIRFDNRFFLLEWPEDETLQPHILPGELASGEWIEPEEALATWRRGEVITSPPILHILQALADDAPEGALPRLQDPSETHLGPIRRVEFRPGVLLLPLKTLTLPPATHTNTFILGTKEAVLVDPGTSLPKELQILKEAVTDGQDRHGLRFRALWLTHHHPDHIGGLEEMRKFLQVPVCAHAATAEHLKKIGIEVDELLEDGQRVVLDGDPPFPVSIHHTPGHAKGHLCFFDETYKSLVSGDLVAGLGTIVVDPPEGNMDDYLQSLDRMIDLAPATLFPAHGPATADAIGQLGRTREHRLWREEKIYEAWQEGLRTPEELVPVVYEDIPKEVYPLAARQVQAHLDRLRGLGRV